MLVLFQATTFIKDAGISKAQAQNEMSYQITWSMDKALSPTYYMDNKTGAYLAARFAKNNKQWGLATDLYEIAMAFEGDRKTQLDQMIERTSFLLAITSGKFDLANRLADNRDEPGQIKALKTTLKSLELAKKGQQEKALSLIETLPNHGVHLYTKTLLKPWLRAHALDLNAAQKTLSELPRLSKNIKNPLQDITIAMIADHFNDHDAAKDYYAQAAEQYMTLPSASLMASYHARQGDLDEATNIHEEILSLRPNYDESHLFLDKGRTLSEHRLSKAQDGIAYTLLNLATFLYEQESLETALIYAQLSRYIAPEVEGSWLLIGDIMKDFNHEEAALDYYKHIHFNGARNNTTARLKMVDLYASLNQSEKAIQILEKAYEGWHSNRDIAMQYADQLRLDKQSDKALKVYKDMQPFHAEVLKLDWRYYYGRAMSHIDLEQFDRGEEDLQTAIKIAPHNPVLLNYLGYHWISQDKNLEAAKEMLELAVSLDPRNGYILDSMGLAHYKLGNYEQAIFYLEQALSELPFNHEVNENLGDAYWKMGRHVEARYQWEKALALSDSQILKTALKDKLAYGLIEEDTTIGLRLDQEAKSLRQAH